MSLNPYSFLLYLPPLEPSPTDIGVLSHDKSSLQPTSIVANMLSFLASKPPRTKIAHLNPIPLDDGRSSVEFKPPTDRYLVINRLPPAASDQDVAAKRVPNKANCSLAPPLHWHYYQEETFHVLEGTARFTIAGKVQIASAGDVVVIPRQEIHTFCNASEETELVVEFVLDPSTRADDEAYFST
jgi:mannose-6-phosphate isomerase-like protein (cupin superfamily)